jgi:hypothetical protein
MTADAMDTTHRERERESSPRCGFAPPVNRPIPTEPALARAPPECAFDQRGATSACG